MARTIIVSNRLPGTVVPDTDGRPVLRRSSGGLVSALLPVHQQSESVWIGAAGGDLTPEIEKVLRDQRLHPVPVAPSLYHAFYNGESNGAIWPLFHYFPALTHFVPANWRAYKEVNERFAQAAAELAQDGDTVWVHDYQLMLVPALVRRLKPTVRIGYFHHIPFPASEVVKLHPAREALLEGLLGADFIGFHTLEYVRHFVGACERLLGVDTSADEITYEDRVVRAGALPLGIDVGSIAEAVAHPDHARNLDALRTVFAGRRVMLGVDRLDYTKGIPERLEAFAEMLRRHPMLHGSAVLVQLCVPTREEVQRYAELREQVERTVSRLNGELGRPGYTPIEYLHQSVDLRRLTALYAVADACLVTPLRDGLNLVCKEYVATRTDLGGMLVLSEFAGAAEEMGEAVVVNPNDLEGSADAFAQSLTLSEDDRRSRMAALRERVTSHDNRAWARTFLAEVALVVARNRAHETRDLDVEGAKPLAASLAGAPRRLLVIDHGILGGLSVDQRWDQATRDALRDRVNALMAKDRCAVGVISGRGPEECDRLLRGLQVWLCAGHGRWLRPPHGDWREVILIGGLDQHRQRVLDILTACAGHVPRSRLEIDGDRIAWHHRHLRSPMALSIARETAHAITQLLAKSPFYCALTRTGLEVRSWSANAGAGVEFLARAAGLGDEGWLVTIGDRYSDDGMFRFAEARNVAIAVGAPVAAADWLVPRPQDVPPILDALFASVEDARHERAGAGR